MKNIYVYDFDKTIYKRDSSLDFWLFCLKKRPSIYKYLPIQIVMFILNKMNLVKTKKFKEIFFRFLEVFTSDEIEKNVYEFWEENKKYFCEWFLNRNKKGIEIVISASPEFLLYDICRENNIEIIIATDMNYKGIIKGENCKGNEKVMKLNQNFKEYVIEEFYSDSDTDFPLVKLAKKAYKVKNGHIEDWTEF